MGNKKIINEIKPFNDIFYKSCFYNAVFPVIDYLGHNYLAILVNDVHVYKFSFSKNSIDFGVEYISINSIEKMLESCGIGFISKNYCRDVIEDIISSISKKDQLL